MYKLLCKLNIHEGAVYDNVPTNVMNKCAEELSGTLTELINYAFKKKRFTDDMKRPEIAPIFNMNDDMLKGNYRPISIISILSKAFETIVAVQLMGYFKSILMI